MKGNTNIRASGSPDGLPIYGEGGLFGVCGVDPVLVNAMVGPIGVERILPWLGSNEDRPIYDAIVDIDSSGDSQSSGCADCGKPTFSECAQTFPYGRICQQTNEMQFDQINRRMNRGVNTMAIFGPITDPAGGVIVPQGSMVEDQFALNVAGVAYNLRRFHGVDIWTGDPTNNTGGRKYFRGLEGIVNTGYHDALKGLRCEALDSQLIDYGSQVIGESGNDSILAYIRALVLAIRYRISRMNLNPETAEMYIVMRPEMWEAVAHAAACEYGLECNVGATTNQDALEVARMRDRFMAESVLPIDGKDYPVIIDNLMSVSRSAHGNGTKHCSDIFVLTTQVEGQRALWGEYLNFNEVGGAALAYLRQLFGNNPIAITDGGRFAHAPTFSGGFCFDVRTLMSTRIVARMPQLQGRVQNVCAKPLYNKTYPDVTGSDDTYELAGGVSTKPYLYLYPPRNMGDAQR